MSRTPQRGSHAVEKERKLVTIPQIPALLEAAGLKKIGPARIRQLAAEDGDWPAPVFQHGRTRVFDWGAVEQYFRKRILRQGERTDLKRNQVGTGEASDGRKGE